MATRKQKHARALKKREAFLKTAHEGSSPMDQLKSLQTQLIQDQKVKTSKRLAKEHRERQLARSKSPNGVQINAEYALDRMNGAQNA